MNARQDALAAVNMHVMVAMPHVLNNSVDVNASTWPANEAELLGNMSMVMGHPAVAEAAACAAVSKAAAAAAVSAVVLEGASDSLVAVLPAGGAASVVVVVPGGGAGGEGDVVVVAAAPSAAAAAAAGRAVGAAAAGGWAVGGQVGEGHLDGLALLLGRLCGGAEGGEEFFVVAFLLEGLAEAGEGALGAEGGLGLILLGLEVGAGGGRRESVSALR